MAPDAAELPKRVILEAVAPDPLDVQLEALAAHGFELRRADLTRSGDTADSLLKRLGVHDPAAAAFLRSDAGARKVLEGRPGKMVQVRANEDGELRELVARFPTERSEQVATHFTRLSVSRDAVGWHTRLDTAALQAQVRLGSGTVRSSLFAATDEAGMPDSIAVQMAELFAGDIDFHRELRRGDTFSVVYEALTADDEPINWAQGTGRVLAASVVNGGREHHALWFNDPSGRGAYFGFDGSSKRRAFLASPMEFSRVTSGFAMRMHPIAQTWRAHRGVDYGAPSGTAVRAVGDGVIDFSGWQNGYGNVVQIKHGGNRSTLYAHLSRADVKLGQVVEQGQRIGAVGSTGWSTGPHLHFEFRVDGQHQDPQQVARTSEVLTLSAKSRPVFEALALNVRSQLGVAHELLGARASGE